MITQLPVFSFHVSLSPTLMHAYRLVRGRQCGSLPPGAAWAFVPGPFVHAVALLLSAVTSQL